MTKVDGEVSVDDLGKISVSIYCTFYGFDGGENKELEQFPKYKNLFSDF